MTGRHKAKREGIIILAHQTEAMARQKRLKPLADYLQTRKRVGGVDPKLFAVAEAWQKKGLMTIRDRPKAIRS